MARRSVTASVDEELLRQLDGFVVLGEYASRGQAVNTILREYFAATPGDGAVRAAQERALSETRRWLEERVRNFLHETQQLLLAAAEADHGREE